MCTSKKLAVDRERGSLDPSFTVRREDFTVLRLGPFAFAVVLVRVSAALAAEPMAPKDRPFIFSAWNNGEAIRL